MTSAPLSTSPDPALLRVAEVGKRLGVSRATAYRLVRSGVLPSMTPLGTCLVPLWAVEQFARTRQAVAFADASVGPS